MFCYLTVIVYLMIGAIAALGGDLENANRKYNSGDYHGAAQSYELLIKEKGPDAAAFFNLGNSYQKLQQYGPAILAYERARLLQPRDPDLIANLVMARKAATAFDDATGRNPLEYAVHYLSRDEWSWFVATAALVLGLVTLWCGAVSLNKRGKMVSRVVCALAGMVIISGSVALWLRREESDRGVVLAKDATLRLSPFSEAELIGTPGEGMLVRLGQIKGNFRFVEIPGASLQGWLPTDQVDAVEPQ